MFVGCQSDEVLEQDSGNDRPTPTGDTRITIEGEGMKDVTTRSSDGRVDFTGDMQREQDYMMDASMFGLKPILMLVMR